MEASASDGIALLNAHAVMRALSDLGVIGKAFLVWVKGTDNSIAFIL